MAPMEFKRCVGLGHFEGKTNRQNRLLDQRWDSREGGAMGGFPFSGLESSTGVRQTVGGTGLGM